MYTIIQIMIGELFLYMLYLFFGYYCRKKMNKGENLMGWVVFEADEDMTREGMWREGGKREEGWRGGTVADVEEV